MGDHAPVPPGYATAYRTSLSLCVRVTAVLLFYVQGTPRYVVFFSPSIVQFSQHILLETGCLQPNTRARLYSVLLCYIRFVVQLVYF